MSYSTISRPAPVADEKSLFRYHTGGFGIMSRWIPRAEAARLVAWHQKHRHLPNYDPRKQGRSVRNEMTVVARGNEDAYEAGFRSRFHRWDRDVAQDFIEQSDGSLVFGEFIHSIY